MDWALFASTFGLIFLAELPDKTAFATLLMATRGKPAPIFVGVAAAFVVQSFVAILFGGLLSKLPEAWVHLGAGILFLAFAFMAWKKGGEEEEAASEGAGKSATAAHFWGRAWASFLVIFIAEWGDLTQLATAAMAAKTAAPFTIFFAATLALWSVTAIAIFLGSHAQKLINPQLLQKIAAVAFAAIGLYFVGTWFFAKG